MKKNRYNLDEKDIEFYPLKPEKDKIPDYYNESIGGRKPYKEMEKNLPKKLFSYQYDHFNRMVYILLNHSNNTAGDFSDMGNGKTVIACAIILYLGLDAVVTCIKTMIGDWKETIIDFGISERIQLISTFESIRSTKKKNREGEAILLKHGYLFRTDITLDDKKKTQVTTFAPTEKLTNLIQKGCVFIFDEIQFIKNPKSDQSNACYELIRHIPPNSVSKVLLLSRTVIDKTIFSETLLKMFGILRGEMFYFMSKFGGGSTYKTVEWTEMVEKARSYSEQDNKIVNDIFRNVYLRAATDFRRAAWFLFRDVFRCYFIGEMFRERTITTDVANGFYTFPPDITKKITVELAEVASCLRFQKDLKDKNTIDTAGLQQAMPHLNNIQRLKKHKVAEVTLEDLHNDPDCKVTIYLSFKDIIPFFEKTFNDAGYKTLVLTGDVSEVKRKEITKLFQREDREYSILISILRVGGIGINIDDRFGYKQRRFYFMLDFRALDVMQGIKRGDRVTTKQLTDKPALYARLFFTNTPYGTYEKRIYDILCEKKNIVSQCLSKEDKNLLPTRIVYYDINNKVTKEMDSFPEGALPPINPMDLKRMFDEVYQERREEAERKSKDNFDFKDLKRDLPKRDLESESSDESSDEDSSSEEENINDID